MRELIKIIEEGNRLHLLEEAFCLATVVKIGGSTYRRPGARMLIKSDGSSIGTVSGGCLESEIALQGLDVITDGSARVIEFTLDEDDLIYGFGSGCNGTVRVLLQKIDPSDKQSLWPALSQIGQNRDDLLLSSVVGPSGAKCLGSHLLLGEDGAIDKSSMPLFILNPLVHNLEKEWTSFGSSETVALDLRGEQFRVFVERIMPPPRLMIFGEGVDANEVSRLAAELSWKTAIVGRKSPGEMKEKLPFSGEHFFLMHPEESASTFIPDSRTAALVMNHNYVRDKAVLKALLDIDLPYIGVLGPRERGNQMLEEIDPMASSFHSKVHAPMGLNIGSETPEEIALSIISEVQAVFTEKNGGYLKDQSGPIH